MTPKETKIKPTLIESDDKEFALAKENYILLLIGFAIIVLGFILMSGGKTDDPAVFSDKIFSFRRVTLAPILVLFGFIFEIYAIMKKPKQKKVNKAE
jgi:membrane-bound ClpP family serine protease